MTKKHKKPEIVRNYFLPTEKEAQVEIVDDFVNEVGQTIDKRLLPNLYRTIIPSQEVNCLISPPATGMEKN